MAQPADHNVAQRELRDDSGGAVERGGSFTITRSGTPMVRLVPRRRRTFVPREEVLAVFATAPTLDADRLRNDLDTIAH